MRQFDRFHHAALALAHAGACLLFVTTGELGHATCTAIIAGIYALSRRQA